jgi:2-polyprenyl-3-methyl-5-hydroxy-6-metoxy-1,4-benzoquinol methylase
VTADHRVPAEPPDPAFDAFAEREPFFAVVTNSRYRARVITPDARREFFAAGEAVVHAIVRRIELAIDPQFGPTSILEYGCGVGRLAVPLARIASRRGGRVVAVDRSAAMLRHASVHADTEGVGNIAFAGPDETLAGGRQFDLVTCYLVLQRLPPAEGLTLVRRLLTVLLPGGVGAFQFPVASRSAPLTRALRLVRARVPGANAIVERLRGHGAAEPFIPTHVYAVNDVLALFREAGVEATHVVFDDHGDLSSVIALVAMPAARNVAGVADAPDVADGLVVSEPAPIDVRTVIAETSIEALNEAAEQYFATLTGWDHHLAKPFATADEAPELLADAAVVLRGLDLRPGLTVLDFGCGTGWLSRCLTQLGCHVVALDVSATALEMARALYQRVPVVGAQPAPQFLRFDGRRIDLADASVDRIVCFHAFHHAPNPDEVIREFGRVLRPGGVAAFAEPGPTHSQSAKSQFEMRSFRVVENDVDVHRVWRAAQASGFDAIRMLATGGAPRDVSLDEYEQICRGGEAAVRWMTDARRHLRNTSNFRLIKGGASPAAPTSRDLAAVIHLSKTPRAVVGRPTSAWLRVTNSGRDAWPPADDPAGGVSVGLRVFDEAGTLRQTITGGRLTEPARAVAPGETVECLAEIPALPAGRYRVELDCVAAGVTWFSQAGSRPVVIPLDVSTE